jgi:hypothetical protein
MMRRLDNRATQKERQRKSDKERATKKERQRKSDKESLASEREAFHLSGYRGAYLGKVFPTSPLC